MSIIDNIRINQNFGEKATKSIDEQRKDESKSDWTKAEFFTSVVTQEDIEALSNYFTLGRMNLGAVPKDDKKDANVTNLNIVAEDAMGFHMDRSMIYKWGVLET
jgi:hypothetical protein